MSPVAAFVDALQQFPTLPAVFNPWLDVDPVHDLGPISPQTRRSQLQRYLEERLGKARFVLIAEALGYKGGHFSGIAMTSERILLGHMAKKGIHAEDVIAGGGARSSRPGRPVPVDGFTEPTATVTWGAIKGLGIDPREVVLWNAFAFHPMRGAGQWLTNRKPTAEELAQGQAILLEFLTLFPGAKVVAVGGVSSELLRRLGQPAGAEVRHPANGGVPAFLAGMQRELTGLADD
ncbi:MAG: uracil-DNA glycosylase [Polaromonas sp.]|nr:uracil-DNA glycosylase [Polaromonas sp.]